MTLDDSSKSRADLQAKLRKERRSEKRQRHRWRRRILIALGAVVLIAVLGAAGVYEYANYQFDQIKKIHSKHLVAQAPPGQPFTLLFVGSDSRNFVQTTTPRRSAPSARPAMPVVNEATSPWWPGSCPPPRP